MHVLTLCAALALVAPYAYTAPASELLCTETCDYPSDDDCDDGGPGSQFAACDLGTDCTDCGPRDDELRGIEPSPEPATEECIDDCNWMNDGYCDDGGIGAQYSDCPYGFDCSDCGPRVMEPPPPSMPPAYPPLSPMPSGAAVLVDVPTLSVRYSFARRLTTPAEVRNLTATLSGFAGCSSYPSCEVRPVLVLERPVMLEGLSLVVVFANAVPIASPSPPSDLYGYDASPPPTTVTLFRRRLGSGATQPVAIDPAASERADAVMSALRSQSIDASPNGILAALGITALPAVTRSTTAQQHQFPPSPPPVVPPPAAPPGLCTSTCNDAVADAQPGVCNDGGPGDPYPFLRLCPIGSDCADCGSRDFCVDCPGECQERNNMLRADESRNACLQSEYTNDACDLNCNNRECGYDRGVCTYSQIKATCLPVQDAAQIDYSTKPTAGGLTVRSGARGDGFEYRGASAVANDPGARSSGLVPVALALDLSPVRTILNQEFAENILFQELQYTLQWRDPRLSSSPCAGALEGMLSMSFEQGLSDIARENARSTRARFWVPTLQPGSASAPGFKTVDEEASFALDANPEGMEWIEGYGGALPEVSAAANGHEANSPSAAVAAAAYVSTHVEGHASCVECASWTGDMELQLLQPHHDFFYYPFDLQRLEVAIHIPGTHLYGCTGTGADSPVLASIGLTEENKNEKLLPPTGEWSLKQRLGESIKVAHPRDKRGREKLEYCVVTIHASREPTVFIFRSLITTIIVVFGSMMTALLMHPEQHSGDRAAVLYIAFLISLTNMATTDLGLGKVSELLWYDLFNLLQLVLSLVAVAETMVVHLLFARNQAKLATHIDVVCRYTLPTLYIAETAGIFLLGIARGRVGLTTLGLVVMIGFACALIPATLCLVWSRSTALSRHQAHCIRHLVHASPEDGHEYDAAVSSVFRAFDVDGSGELDMDELRDLFGALHPKIKRDDLRACLKRMAEFVDVATGTLSEPKFIDALIEGDQMLNERLQLRGESITSANGAAGTDGADHAGERYHTGILRRKEPKLLRICNHLTRRRIQAKDGISGCMENMEVARRISKSHAEEVCKSMADSIGREQSPTAHDPPVSVQQPVSCTQSVAAVSSTSATSSSSAKLAADSAPPPSLEVPTCLRLEEAGHAPAHPATRLAVESVVLMPS
mmetsp:Transcript_9115/g.23876  ORF Transcript_9115/g.23876 Transcript_9115/m.23876 type:complete len:1171 (+) Transcript_9115:57-3569(+)